MKPLLRLAVLLLAALSGSLAASTPERSFVIEEATIGQVHAAFKTGALTCTALVNSYIARIERYDRQGPALGAIASVNPQAARDAARLDREFQTRGLTGPLHCVPVILKDNILTAGWETTAGVAALAGFIPDHDATAVTRLKAAGAILLAKATMPDLALNTLTTVNLLHGPTRNPYGLDRVPAGSSGGTTVAIAANFGLVGLGTDTGGSVRGPAAHAAVVGLRPTFGFNSRAGVVPLDVDSDTVGPVARTVEDVALVLDVLTGWDPADPSTEAVRRLGTVAPSAAQLHVGLDGIRIGILSQAYHGGPRKIDGEVAGLFARALNDLSSLGVQVVDTVTLRPLPNLPAMHRCRGLRYNLDEFLAREGAGAPVRSFDEIVASGRYHPSLASELRLMQSTPHDGPDSQACRDAATYRAAVVAVLTAAMDRDDLDALVYPTWSQPPQRATQIDLPSSGQTMRFASATGFPAVTVPMGFTAEVLPVGLSLLGRKWDDAALLRLAYAYEQATRHRRPPLTAPPIRCLCPEIH